VKHSPSITVITLTQAVRLSLLHESEHHVRRCGARRRDRRPVADRLSPFRRRLLLRANISASRDSDCSRERAVVRQLAPTLSPGAAAMPRRLINTKVAQRQLTRERPMKKLLGKVFGLFAARPATPPATAAESGSETCSATNAVADQNKNNGQGGSSGASSHRCCGNSDTRKLPTMR